MLHAVARLEGLLLPRGVVVVLQPTVFSNTCCSLRDDVLHMISTPLDEKQQHGEYTNVEKNFIRKIGVSCVPLVESNVVNHSYMFVLTSSTTNTTISLLELERKQLRYRLPQQTSLLKVTKQRFSA